MIEFEDKFAQFVANNIPVTVLAQLSQAYYGRETLFEIFDDLPTPDEIELKKALDHYRGGDRIT